MKLTKAKKDKLGKGLTSFRNYRPEPSEAYAPEEQPGPSIRRAVHRGREIEIHTHYDIRIDGEPLQTHVVATESGRVTCHALPNYGFRSTVDLVRKLIDTFSREMPEDELNAKVKRSASRKTATRAKPRAREKRG